MGDLLSGVEIVMDVSFVTRLRESDMNLEALDNLRQSMNSKRSE